MERIAEDASSGCDPAGRAGDLLLLVQDRFAGAPCDAGSQGYPRGDAIDGIGMLGCRRSSVRSDDTGRNAQRGGTADPGTDVCGRKNCTDGMG